MVTGAEQWRLNHMVSLSIYADCENMYLCCDLENDMPSANVRGPIVLMLRSVMREEIM